MKHWQCQAYKCALPGERVGEEKTCWLTALGPSKTMNNGAGRLDTNSGTGVGGQRGWLLSVFCRRDCFGAGKSLDPRNLATF